MALRAAATRRARVALVGAGGWAQGWHLPNLHARQDAEIAALVDPSAHPSSTFIPGMVSVAELSARYGGVPCYSSVDEMIADAPKLAVDGIICSTPHAAHFDVGMKAIDAGLHLLMEKPLTTDVGEARALLDAARRRPEQAFLLNNTANWREGTRRVHGIVSEGRIGEVRHVNCLFATPLGWLFEDPKNAAWVTPSGTMLGNGFGWGQFSHTFAWVFKVTGLTPRSVYAASTPSVATGADLFNALTITCTNGATIVASGVGAIPGENKVVGNWVFGSRGMLSYSGIARGEGAGEGGFAYEGDVPAAEAAATTTADRLEFWADDGTHERGPRFEFEYLEQTGTGPGSMDALVQACLGLPYFRGAGPEEGLKAVVTIDAMYRSILSGRPEHVADQCT